jgi:hypothetical protein
LPQPRRQNERKCAGQLAQLAIGELELAVCAVVEHARVTQTSNPGRKQSRLE